MAELAVLVIALLCCTSQEEDFRRNTGGSIKDFGAKNVYLKIIKVNREWECKGREVKYFDLLF